MFFACSCVQTCVGVCKRLCTGLRRMSTLLYVFTSPYNDTGGIRECTYVHQSSDVTGVLRVC